MQTFWLQPLAVCGEIEGAALAADAGANAKARLEATSTATLDATAP